MGAASIVIDVDRCTACGLFGRVYPRHITETPTSAGSKTTVVEERQDLRIQL